MKLAVALRKGIDKNNISVEQFFKLAKKNGIECEYLSDKPFDILVTFGGDGTTLHYAKKYFDKPIIAVNMGHIGFLSQLPPSVDHFQVFFSALKSKKYKIISRILLNIQIEDRHFLALNDIMVCSLNRGRTIRVYAELNNAEINTYNCDGVIVCTPTGSTAHNLSFGGSAITQNSKVFCLTPIAGINNNFPVIYSDNSKLKLKSIKEQIAIYADGDLLDCVADEIFITKSDIQAKFLQLEDSFFAKLRTKNVY